MVKPALHESTQRYISDARVARGYDCYFAGQNLFGFDTEVLGQWFKRPGRLVDLGCGTGRHLIKFACCGFEVTGVDISEHMLGHARAKLDQARISARLVHADFCKLPLGRSEDDGALRQGSYDYALCMFSTMGMIYGRENRLEFLRTVYRLLKPGGQLALHVHNIGYNIWHHEGRMFLLSNFIKSRLGLAEIGDKYLSRYRGIKGMYVHVFSEAEITDLLREAGFRVGEVLPLNRRRNGAMKSNILRAIRANGFLLRAETINQFSEYM